jgi:hypothetical protein
MSGLSGNADVGLAIVVAGFVIVVIAAIVAVYWACCGHRGGCGCCCSSSNTHDCRRVRRDFDYFMSGHMRRHHAHDELHERIEGRLDELEEYRRNHVRDHETLVARLQGQISDLRETLRLHTENPNQDIGALRRELIILFSDHHHRISLARRVIHAPNYALSALAGAIAFLVMSILDWSPVRWFALPKSWFVNHFAIVVKHVSIGTINLDWNWARLGLAFAVAVVVFVAFLVFTGIHHEVNSVTDELTGPPITEPQQAP